MSDRTSKLSACTVQRRNGAFCDAPSMPDVPFPICGRHALKLYKHLAETVQHVMLGPASTPGAGNAAAAARQAAQRAQSLVYYVKIHDSIKIGYTGNMKQRMTALRVPHSAVMATEPGGRGLELTRHKQFADLRIGIREDFQPAPKLLDHIVKLRRQYGEPNITGYVRV